MSIGKAIAGNAVIGQSGGPTCVINQSLIGVVQEVAKNEVIDHLYGARHGIKGMLEEDFVDLLKEDKDTLAKVAGTPSAALGSVRMKPTKEDCVRVFEILKKYDVHYFFYIGGNDSAETADIVNQLSTEAGYELRCFHIPKTIDNDLLVTDHCPGYGTAAKFVACALMGDNLDNRSLGGIKIDVIMGRHAGFLTAASALGRTYELDGPHLIYLPEVAFDRDKFIDDVERVYSTAGRCVIAVSEGVSDADGNAIGATGEVDDHGNVQLSGSGALGDHLVKLIRDKLGARLNQKLRVRADTFGYLQRCFPGMASEVDAKEARMVGEWAVRYAVAGNIDGSVALRRFDDDGKYACDCFLTPLSTVARKTKDFPAEFIHRDGNDVTPAFIEYARPLVGDLPAVARLAGRSVPKR